MKNKKATSKASGAGAEARAVGRTRVEKRETRAAKFYGETSGGACKPAGVMSLRSVSLFASHAQRPLVTQPQPQPPPSAIFSNTCFAFTFTKIENLHSEWATTGAGGLSHPLGHTLTRILSPLARKYGHESTHLCPSPALSAPFIASLLASTIGYVRKIHDRMVPSDRSPRNGRSFCFCYAAGDPFANATLHSAQCSAVHCA